MSVLPVFIELQKSPEVVAHLGTRIYQGIAPPNKIFPYAVWSGMGDTPSTNLDCRAQISQRYFQLVVFDTQATRAEIIRDAILKSLPYPDCTDGDLIPDMDEMVGDLKIFGRGFDANWWFDR
ncbi:MULTISPECIES: tail completion protein gp17 [Acinetobacter]|jgi:hypothetical protein|uniref:tail completion protein gp17 n=1 Tax=Acinetobacter TaxID=469 RepID=UPI0022E4140A|nr:DUF3168 domain-containing protein [Acinetobacter guillouiae]